MAVEFSGNPQTALWRLCEQSLCFRLGAEETVVHHRAQTSGHLPARMLAEQPPGTELASTFLPSAPLWAGVSSIRLYYYGKFLICIIFKFQHYSCDMATKLTFNSDCATGCTSTYSPAILFVLPTAEWLQAITEWHSVVSASTTCPTGV